MKRIVFGAVWTLCLWGVAAGWSAQEIGFSGHRLVPAGSVSAPGLAPATDPDTGFYDIQSGLWHFASNGIVRLAFGSGLYMGTNPIRFGSSVGAGDALISRGAAGQVKVLGADGVNNGALAFGPATFASLGTPDDGVIMYCSDCTIASPCAGSGTGAIAKRLNSTWVCN